MRLPFRVSLASSERLALDLLVPLVILTIATLMASGLSVFLATPRVGVLFLTAVMLSGAARGLTGGLFAALVGTLSYNYFLVGNRTGFQFPTDDELYNMALFVAAAVLTGMLTARLRTARKSATRRADILKTLLLVERMGDAAVVEESLLTNVEKTVREVLPSLAFELWSPKAPPAASEVARVGRLTREVVTDGEVVGVLSWCSGAKDFDSFVELLADRLAVLIGVIRSRDLADRLKTERVRTLLLASVSHDFRSPLATIIAATSSLIDLDDQLSSSTRLRLISSARDEAERLDRFVNQLLGAMRNDNAEARETEPLEVVAQLQILADRFNSPLLRAQVEVAGTKCRLSVREALFSQAFANIIENAVKHSPVDETVKVRARRVGDKIHVVVDDRGPGVPKADLDRIFDQYFQAGPGKGRNGYGIGLTVARFNINAMGGAVDAANRPGGGLRVTAQFPVHAIGVA
ncbi:ATP-binding protein [Brevundimonas sp. Root1423]|uniref:sensor histidine kinase n=1 Tax=Brevundimonas sp. Root1423 TaxID=1736462 RepID=UPI0006F7557F|nr:ATP-binding protein [Brevundimonas sp. Root1423]KQY75391.1 hypothetical protein ASD25_12715 [Brevundimonas sp. Root1423]